VKGNVANGRSGFNEVQVFGGIEMVFYFTSHVVSPAFQLFMGEDKHENEELIKWDWPEDVWFHVDKMSSAHVYLRLRPLRSHTHTHTLKRG
jgi:predicted ribosome quality control (RQC) complex YloA/Tae2 family protein